MIEIRNTVLPLREDIIQSRLSELFDSSLNNKRIHIVNTINNTPSLDGYAFLGGHDIYISAKKLNEEYIKFFYLIIHEVMHSLGLKHCNNKDCIMYLKQINKKRVYGWKTIPVYENLKIENIFCKDCRIFINQIKRG